MTRITKIGLAVLLASSALATGAMAQETQPPKLDQQAPDAATSAAPGQTKPAGEAATGKAPGQLQKAGEADAKAAAPGQVKPTDGQAEAGTTDQPAAGTKAATDAAPGQQQKMGEADAKDAAPGQMQKTGEADAATDAAPGQVKTEQAGDDAPSDETTASIDISAEQKTEIRTIIQETRVEPATVDIDLRVGVAVPTTVEFHPLPTRIVEIVPQYRGYEYFLLADGRIIIVEPATHEVVYILVV